ncbi:MAG: hypothetical protein ACRDUA_16760 [Micromonosporaceae bacterium]
MPCRKTNGERHVAAQRNLFNRLLGCLFHCIHQGIAFNEQRAFPRPLDVELAASVDGVGA